MLGNVAGYMDEKKRLLQNWLVFSLSARSWAESVLCVAMLQGTWMNRRGRLQNWLVFSERTKLG